MSLITRCPSCQTLFKLVPDQLRISEGWVRCGQCAQAFDASQHLVQPHPAVKTALTAKSSEAVPAEAPPATLSLAVTDLTGQSVVPDGHAGPILNSPEDHTTAIEEDGAAATGVAVAASAVAQAPAEPMPEPVVAGVELMVPVQASSLANQAPDAPEFSADADPRDVSFLRDAKPLAARSGTWASLTGVALSSVLLLGLAAQILVQERHRIAAVQPQLKPGLQALCQPLDCSVLPWKDIDSIVIESSAFTRLRGDSYRLSFTLKNASAVSVATPALELTLTDSLDQPVIRRVLMWSELSMTSNALDAGLEQTVSVALAVNPMGGTDRIAGYRLLAFYP